MPLVVPSCSKKGLSISIKKMTFSQTSVWEDINRPEDDATIYRRAINISSGSSAVSSSSSRARKDPGGRNAAVHPDGVRGGRGKRGQSERAAANEDEESSGARKMGRPAFHPPPGLRVRVRVRGVGLERAPKAAGASR